MGMSTFVTGFREPDDEWRRMKGVYDACVAAGVAPPPAVDSFFQGKEPDDAGIEVDLMHGPNAIAREWRAEMREGYEIRLSDIRASVTSIRFYNSF